MDVDLVSVKHGFLGAGARFEGAELGEPTLARVALPREENDGLGHAESSTDAGESAAHGAHRDRRPALPLHLEAEKLSGPRRPTPTEIFWRAAKKLDDVAPEAAVHLCPAVTAALVVEPHDAFVGEAGLAEPELGDDLEAHRGLGVAARTPRTEQKAALHPADPAYNVHAGDSQTSEDARVFPSTSQVDRHLCAVI